MILVFMESKGNQGNNQGQGPDQGPPDDSDAPF